MGIYDKVVGGLFPTNIPAGLLGAQGLSNAQNQGLLSLGAAMMAAGGPSVGKPVSFGQALNQGVQAGQQAFNQSANQGMQIQQMADAKAAQQQQQKLAQAKAAQEAKMVAHREKLASSYDKTNPQLAAAIRAGDTEVVKNLMTKPKVPPLRQKLIEAGYQPGTPEYEQAARNFLEKPTGTTIDMGGSADKLVLTDAIKRVGASADAVDSARGTLEVVNRISKALPEAWAGPGATVGQSIDQVASMLGVGGKTSEERLSSTRTVIQGLAELTLNSRDLLKGQGQITENEQKVLEKAKSGDIADMTQKEIKVLLDVTARASMAVEQNHVGLLERASNVNGLSANLDFYKRAPLPEYTPAVFAEGSADKSPTQATSQSGSVGSNPFSGVSNEEFMRSNPFSAGNFGGSQ
jgi:hypothetical protein